MNCAICGKPIWSFSDLDSDHKIPGKMGGCRNDDPDNLQPTHKFCNMKKGSRRVAAGELEILAAQSAGRTA